MSKQEVSQVIIPADLKNYVEEGIRCPAEHWEYFIQAGKTRQRENKPTIYYEKTIANGQELRLDMDTNIFGGAFSNFVEKNLNIYQEVSSGRGSSAPSYSKLETPSEHNLRNVLELSESRKRPKLETYKVPHTMNHDFVILVFYFISCLFSTLHLHIVSEKRKAVDNDRRVRGVKKAWDARPGKQVSKQELHPNKREKRLCFQAENDQSDRGLWKGPGHQETAHRRTAWRVWRVG